MHDIEVYGVAPQYRVPWLLGTTALLELRLVRGRLAPRATAALAARRTRLRVHVVLAMLARQRGNRRVERLWRLATNARRAPTAWATAHNRRRAPWTQFLRGNTARLVRQLQRARPVQRAARAPAGRRTRVREMHCRAARGVCDIAGKLCVTVGECDV